MSTALLTDRYELTMLGAALDDGTADRQCVFEVFGRRLPGGRRYGVVAGTGRLLEAIAEFRFGPTELAWLEQEGVVGPRALDYLSEYRFGGRVSGYREGELYFPNSPILRVESSFADGVVLETLALSILNADSAIATAASRMVSAAAGRPLAEMGSRRTGEYSAVAAARAAWISGFGATSNLEAGRRWGIPTMGTAAHAFTLLHDSEAAAFRAQVRSMGTDTTLLVDTFDIGSAVRTAVEVAGTGLGSVRIDSGDLPTVVAEVRRLLDALGASRTTITVTNDLDEHSIAALAASPVDAYGVGTALVGGSGHPAAGFVYKLVARTNDDGTWRDVGKRSASKSSVGGRKSAERQLDAHGIAVAERVLVDHDDVNASGSDAAARSLVVPLMTHGEPVHEYLGAAGVRAAREHHAAAMAELPEDAFRLSGGDPAIPTVIVGA